MKARTGPLDLLTSDDNDLIVQLPVVQCQPKRANGSHLEASTAFKQTARRAAVQQTYANIPR